MKKLIFAILFLFCSTALAQAPLWNFSRSTAAKKSFSTGGIRDTAINVPRVTDGVEIEGQAIQLHGLTEAFDSWTSTDCAITPNADVAPDGTTTADLLNNAAATDGRSSVLTASLGSLAGRSFTGSVYVKTATTRHPVTIRIYEDGIAVVASTVAYAESEYTRISVTGTFAGGGTGKIRFYVHPGEYGVSSGSAYFWGANLTEGKFASSYVQNTGAETSQVTRTGDALSIIPNTGNTNYQTRSYQIDQNPPWTPVRSSITNTSTTTLPDGTASSNDVIHEDATAANTHAIYSTTSLTGLWGWWTFSAYLKSINRTWARIIFHSGSSGTCYINLAACTVGTITAPIDVYYLGVNPTCRAESVEYGWCRVSASQFSYYLYGTAYPVIGIAEADNDDVFDGLNQDSIYAWGLQIENKSTPSPYIPTTTASVYSATKSDVLALTYCATCPANKLTIQFESKCEYSGSSQLTSTGFGGYGYGNFITVGSGGANYIQLYLYYNGVFYMYRTAGDSIWSNADPVNLTNWNTIKIFMDYADLSRSYVSIGGNISPTKIGTWTGTATISPTSIQFGNNGGAFPTFCKFKNLRIENYEF